MANKSEGRVIKTGTGFFFTGDGRLITNYHVVENARSIVAQAPSGAYNEHAGVCNRLENLDIAVLTFSATDVPNLSLINAPQVVEGQRVLVIGNPEGLQGIGIDFSEVGAFTIRLTSIFDRSDGFSTFSSQHRD